MDYIERLTDLAKQVVADTNSPFVLKRVTYFERLNGYKFVFDIGNEDEFQFLDVVPAKACEPGQEEIFRTALAQHLDEARLSYETKLMIVPR